MTTEIVAVGVAVPLHQLFDYAVPSALQGRLRPGMRVRVLFGRRRLIGVVVQAPREATADAGPFRDVEEVLDEEPALPGELLALCRWAAEYYHYPLGEVLAAALPGPLRRGAPARFEPPLEVGLTPEGIVALARMPVRFRAQRALLERLAQSATTAAEVPAALLRTAAARGWIEQRAPVRQAGAREAPPQLTVAQQALLAALDARPAGFDVSLLEGVTGSGKTEIYLRLIEACLARGAQALVLVPEIGLTPQLAERLQQRFGAGVASFHSGMTEVARAQTWLRARAGAAGVVVGTRSAIFVPFAHLGLVIVDEEHDVSFKQQDGLRYSARDLALVRGKRLQIPVLLGSATPSLESLHKARIGRYRHLRLAGRVLSAAPPQVQLLDVRGLALTHGLSAPLIAAVARHVETGGQALLFINRRGYAPVLLCHDCGWSAPCSNCAARLTLHRARGKLICHHCGAQQQVPAACPSCHAPNLAPIGQGTQRIEDALKNRFPRERVERLDSDRLRRAGELARLLPDIRSGAIRILVGTQVLAKGHDFAHLSLVGIVSADQALYGSDFRAIERMGQLVTQVAGRAGRAGQPGEVLLQTHEPQHPLLQTLVRGGYPALCESLLAERQLAGLPPFSYLALLRAEAASESAALRYLAQVRARLEGVSGVRALDAVPAPMERRAGLFRAQLLLQASERPALQRALARLVPQLAGLPGARAVRWSVDVDPADLF